MKLNKTVCKKCRNNEYDGGSMMLKWNNMHDDLWDRSQKVMCVSNGNILKVNKRIPSYCPYILEHIVLK